MKSVEPIRDIKIIKIMRAILKSQSTRNELLFILGINIGLRISDILKLKVNDIIRSNGKTPRDYVIITEMKTNKTKKFYIGDTVKKVVENYMKEIKNSEPNTYLFLSRKGVNIAITRQQAYRIINNAAESLGLVERNNNGSIISGEIGTHTLRKTFGYHSFQNGTSLELLMDLFNHSSKTQTLKYIGITEEQKKEVYLKSNLG